MKLSKAEAISIIITLIFVAAVIVFTLWSGNSDASVSVSFQNTNSADSLITPSAPLANAYESPSPSGSESSGVPSSSPSAAAGTSVPSPSPSAGAGSVQALININTATASELCSLPGIGEVLAGRIIAYREAHGSFKSTGAIMNVSGIGTAKYKAIKNLIAVN